MPHDTWRYARCVLVFAARALVCDTPFTCLPKVDDLLVEGPRPPAPRRLPDSGEVIVVLCKYTEPAELLWEDVKNPGLGLWQVQVQGGAQT